MKNDSLARFWIGIIIVSTSSLTLLVLTLLHAFREADGSYAEIMRVWGTATSGVTGVVIGYFFGRAEADGRPSA